MRKDVGRPIMVSPALSGSGQVRGGVVGSGGAAG